MKLSEWLDQWSLSGRMTLDTRLFIVAGRDDLTRQPGA